MTEDNGKSSARIKILVSKLEFSKQIIRRMMWVFGAHVMATLAAIIAVPEYGSLAVSLMSATVPLYIVIFAGYFGKAGIENYQKIKSNSYEDNL